MSGFSSGISLDPFRILCGNPRERRRVPERGASPKRHKKKIQSLRDFFDFIYGSFTKVNFRQPFIHTLRTVTTTVDALSTPVGRSEKPDRIQYAVENAGERDGCVKANTAISGSGRAMGACCFAC
jgi:hypothetical protein